MTSRISYFTRHSVAIAVPFALAFCGLVATAAWGQAGTGTIRVSTTGTNFTGCGSAATPCATANNAINQAEAAGDVVKVEEGVYTTFTDCDGNPAVLCMVNDIGTIQGGFAGGDWDTADPVANPTIFDGQNLRRVVRIQDGGVGLPNTASLTLEGVTLRNGFWEGAASGTDTEIFAFGGCVDAINATLFFTDVNVTGCRALGGGTTSSVPDDHGGVGAGGGVAIRGFVENIQTSVFTRVHFEDNIAEGASRSGSGTVRGGFGQGGGLLVLRARLEATDLTFVDNEALGGDASNGSGQSGGGARADAQGAGLCVQVDGDVEIDGVVATGNLAQGGDSSNGSGSIAGGSFGAALFSEQGTLVVRDLDLRDNESRGGVGNKGGLGAGGAVMAINSTLTFDRGTMIGNLSKGGDGASEAGAAGGGAAYISLSDGHSFRNLIVADNVSEVGDLGTAPSGGGGGFFINNSVGTFGHVTLAANQLNADLRGEAIVLLGGSDVTLEYSIVADHPGTGNGRAIHVQSTDAITLDDGLFSGNSQNTNEGEVNAGAYTGLASMTDVGSIDFVSPGSPNFDYHLQSSSPAVDAADASSEALDVDGDSRTDPDTGADELNAPVDEIFTDGFESGNTSAWSLTVN